MCEAETIGFIERRAEAVPADEGGTTDRVYWYMEVATWDGRILSAEFPRQVLAQEHAQRVVAIQLDLIHELDSIKRVASNLNTRTQ